MERTVVQRREKLEEYFHTQSILIAAAAFLLGSSGTVYAFVFSFIFLAYFYMRDEKECICACVGVLCGSLLCGIFVVYLYALGMTMLFLMIHVVKLLNQNAYRLFPFMSAALSVPYTLYAFGLDIRVLCVAFLTYLLAEWNLQDLSWIQKNLVFTSSMYGILLVTLGISLYAWNSAPLDEWLFSVVLILTAFFCEPLELAVILMLVGLVMPMSSLPLYAIAGALWISAWKHQKRELWIGLALLGGWLSLSLPQASLYLIGGMSSLVYDDKKLPFHIARYRMPTSSPSTHETLNKQIQHFSGIFSALSDYYEQISDVEAQMLSEMAKALKYCSDTLKKIDTTQTQKERILKALEGYQYKVDRFDMEVGEEGDIMMEAEIHNIRKSEVHQTLLPLLEVLTHEHLQIVQMEHKRFRSGCHHIVMENRVPFTVDSYADTQKNIFDSSGDTFSVFRYRNTIISMISDGMGSGEHAAASSRLITNLFQRMVVSGISKMAAIKCINKLLQSDAYATLDVICFDCSMGKAYIFKSAACPTFLIRGGELYEVNGSSLPVGIIASIEPDCFVADLQEGDEYLMISDGIFLDEIYEWLNTRDTKSVKASMEGLMEVLRQRQRLDDSTAVLNKVYSNKI